MYNQIWKYQLEISSKWQEIKMAKGSEILSVQIQNNKICMWVSVPDNSEKENRIFITIGTGKDFNPIGLKYISTIQEGIYLWHIFERVEQWHSKQL